MAVRKNPKIAPPIAAPMIGPGEEAIIIRRTLVQFLTLSWSCPEKNI